MALMLGKLHKALIAAGASSDEAREASEEVAAFEARINGLESRIDRLDAKVTLLTWMVGFNMALTAAVLGKMLS